MKHSYEEWEHSYPEWFSWLIDSVDCGSIRKLREKDNEYQAFMSKGNLLQEEFPCIHQLIEEEGALSISGTEHQKILEYLHLRSEMEYRERLLYYWYGHLHCYEYMRKMEVALDETE